MAEEQSCEVGPTLTPLNYRATYIMYGYRFLESTKHLYSNYLYDVKY